MLSGHAIPLRYNPDLCGCIPFGLEADLCVRDLEVTELTMHQGFVFHVPQPTKLGFELVPLAVDERGFVVVLRFCLVHATVSCHSLAYE